MNQEANSEEYDDNEAVQSEEMDEMDVIRVAFDEAMGDNQEEDDVKMHMISAGATFKNVTRLYNQFMIDAGFAISKEDRNQIVDELLSDKDLDTEESFTNAVSAVLEAVKGSTERSAAAIVRSYGKKNGQEVYTKPKNEGTGSGRTGFASSYYDFLAENPRCTQEEAEAFINGEGDHPDTTDNIKKHSPHYLKIWNLVNRVSSQYQ